MITFNPFTNNLDYVGITNEQIGSYVPYSGATQDVDINKYAFYGSIVGGKIVGGGTLSSNTYSFLTNIGAIPLVAFIAGSDTSNIAYFGSPLNTMTLSTNTTTTGSSLINGNLNVSGNIYGKYTEFDKSNIGTTSSLTITEGSIFSNVYPLLIGSALVSGLNRDCVMISKEAIIYGETPSLRLINNDNQNMAELSVSGGSVYFTNRLQFLNGLCTNSICTDTDYIMLNNMSGVDCNLIIKASSGGNSNLTFQANNGSQTAFYNLNAQGDMNFTNTSLGGRLVFGVRDNVSGAQYPLIFYPSGITEIGFTTGSFVRVVNQTLFTKGINVDESYRINSFSGINADVSLAKLTAGGVNGSIIVSGGIIIAYAPPT